MQLNQPRYVIAVPDLARSADWYRDACVIMAGECPDALAPAALGDQVCFAYVQVDGVDALQAEWQARGTEFVKPLRNEPRGMRGFDIRTIDGHRMMFGEPTP